MTSISKQYSGHQHVLHLGLFEEHEDVDKKRLVRLLPTRGAVFENSDRPGARTKLVALHRDAGEHQERLEGGVRKDRKL